MEEILAKLNLTQLKQLITLYGLEKPHSKSNKSDYIKYILSSDANLDAKMLVNYFSIELKPKKQPKKTDDVKKIKAEEIDDAPMEEITNGLENVTLEDDHKQKKTPSRKRAPKNK